MIKIRKAIPEDSQLILDLIIELAIYEKLENEVKATKEKIEQEIFVKNNANVIIAEFDNKAVGYALYFNSFSTFLAKPGIYLEDLFVLEAYRGKGIGKKLLGELAKIALENDFGRIEWSVLNWNEPAIKFYQFLGAEMMNGWTVNRLEGNRINEMLEKII